MQHTAICRRRIADAMAATDVGANQLKRFEGRVDRAIASRIESDDIGAEQQQAEAAVDEDEFHALRGSVRIGAPPCERHT